RKSAPASAPALWLSVDGVSLFGPLFSFGACLWPRSTGVGGVSRNSQGYRRAQRVARCQVREPTPTDREALRRRRLWLDVAFPKAGRTLVRCRPRRVGSRPFFGRYTSGPPH